MADKPLYTKEEMQSLLDGCETLAELEGIKVALDDSMEHYDIFNKIHFKTAYTMKHIALARASHRVGKN